MDGDRGEQRGRGRGRGKGQSTQELSHDARTCENPDCTFAHPTLTVGGGVGERPSNHYFNTAGKRANLEGERKAIVHCKHDHCRAGPDCTFAHPIQGQARPVNQVVCPKSGNCEDMGCSLVHPQLTIVGLGPKPSNHYFNTAGKRANLEGERKALAHCKHDHCRAGPECTFAHPANGGSPTKPTKPFCPSANTCENVRCTFEHPDVTTVFGERPSNHFFNTVGKQAILEGKTKVLLLCKYDNCNQGQNCKYGHPINKGSPTQCPNAKLCENSDCTFAHPTLTVGGGVGERPSNHYFNTAGKRANLEGERKAIVHCKHDHCRAGPDCTFAHPIQVVCPKSGNCEDMGCSLVHPQLTIVGLGPKPSNHYFNTEGKLALLSGKQAVLRTCNFDNCKNGNSCKFAHPVQKGPSPKKPCNIAHTCENVDCPFEHPQISIAGCSIQPSNHFLNTDGKLLFLKGKQVALRACKFEKCSNGSKCKFAHPVMSQQPTKQAPQTPTPEGFLLVDGEMVPTDRFAETEGKKLAMKIGKGKLCTNTACRFRNKCTYLHLALDEGLVTTIANLIEQGANETTPVVNNANAGPGANAEICNVCGDGVSIKEGLHCGGASKHFACDECFSGYVELTWAVREHEPGRVPDLTCWMEGCGHVLSDVSVARHTTESACATYLRLRQTARDGIAMGEAQAMVEKAMKKVKINDDSVENEILAKQLRLQLPNALMCPKCFHGPVDFKACSDLGAHHGQVVGNARIDNSCRKCKFFTKRRDEWLPWDGVIRSRPGTDREHLIEMGFSEGDADFALQRFPPLIATDFLLHCSRHGLQAQSASSLRFYIPPAMPRFG